MRLRCSATIWCLGAVLAFPGCASAGPSGEEDLRSSVFATNRIVQNLDTNLSGTVAKLSDTATTLSARLDTTDAELKQLSSLAAENQRKIERLQASLDSLTATLYRHFNLSAPQTVVAPSVPSAPTVTAPPSAPVSRPGGVVVEPPSTLGQRPAAPAPAGPTEILPPLEGAAPAGATPPAVKPAVDDTAAYNDVKRMYDQQDYAGALKRFDDFLKQFPNGPNVGNATYWKAHCSFRLNDFPTAIQGFEEFRAKFPASDKVPTSMYNQAVAYSRLGQNQRAIELFQQVIRQYPDHAAAEGARQSLKKLQGQP